MTQIQIGSNPEMKSKFHGHRVSHWSHDRWIHSWECFLFRWCSSAIPIGQVTDGLDISSLNRSYLLNQLSEWPETTAIGNSTQFSMLYPKVTYTWVSEGLHLTWSLRRFGLSLHDHISCLHLSSTLDLYFILNGFLLLNYARYAP